MKLQIHMILQGTDSMEEKFKKCISEYPEMQMDLIRANLHLLMLAFRWGKEDKIELLSFTGGKIPDEEEVAVVDEKIKEVET